MSLPASNPVALFGGGIAAAALAAWIWIGWTGSDLDQSQRLIARSERELAELRPKTGMPVEDARTRLKNSLSSQQANVQAALAQLTRPLPPEYQQADKNEVAARLGTVAKDLQLHASSRNIPIPRLSFDNVQVAESEDQRRIQLLNAFQVRRIIESLLDTGIERISELIPREPAADPLGRHVVLTASVVVEGPQAKILPMLSHLRQQHLQGMGLRELTLTPLPDQRASARMVLALFIEADSSRLASRDPATGVLTIRLPREPAPGEAAVTPTAPSQPGAGPRNPFNR